MRTFYQHSNKWNYEEEKTVVKKAGIRGNKSLCCEIRLILKSLTPAEQWSSFNCLRNQNVYYNYTKAIQNHAK